MTEYSSSYSLEGCWKFSSLLGRLIDQSKWVNLQRKRGVLQFGSLPIHASCRISTLPSKDMKEEGITNLCPEAVTLLQISFVHIDQVFSILVQYNFSSPQRYSSVED